MLTDLERAYLKNRDNLEDDKQKKNLNHRIKNKLVLINEALSDVRLILENYPEDLIKEHISENTVYSAATALERILQILDPWPIGEHEDGGLSAFRSWGSVIPASKPGECTIDSISRGVTEEEKVLYKRIAEHFERIRFYVDPCIPDPVCRDPEYIGIENDKAFKIAKDIMNRTGTSLSVSFNAYTDETGISTKGWILRAPVVIPIEKLKAMRWKPRGLKECMKQPPLLKEKRIPIRWLLLSSIGNSSTPEEYEEFRNNIQKKNEMEIDEKDLLEVNEMIKKIPRSEKEFNDKEFGMLKEKLNSMKFKQDHTGAEPFPDRETMWAKAKKATGQGNPQ
jgi:hypothetical protein